MKWFWLVLGVLVVAALVVVIQDSNAARGSRTAVVAPSAPMNAAPVGVAASTPAPAKAPIDSDSSKSAAKPANNATSAENSSKAAGDATTAGATGPAAGASSNAADADRPLPKIEGAEVARGSIEKLADGTIVADKRFRILGAGTAADPYRVSWECLQSAQDTYVPRLGETRIPERIAMLNDSFVRMEGYLAFPLLSAEAKEVLIMFNQWDGCCIGVPPTPYDSIEVKLSESIPNTKRHASFTFGAITGRFKVDPYLRDNWLVGLYLLEDASFEPEEF